MQKWAEKVIYTPKEDIDKYCVDNVVWQTFRRKLKGIPTDQKLIRLKEWLDQWDYSYAALIQVSNYINALKRGGQLDVEGNVVR